MLAIFNVGGWEIFLILIILLLLFGRRLPEVMRSMGQGVNEFKRGLSDVTREESQSPEHPPEAKGEKSEHDDSPAGA